MSFKSWLESRTYVHDLKLVYHWDTDSDFYKVLNKQGRNFPSKRAKKKLRQFNSESLQRVYALWASPNKSMNEFWASYILSSNVNRPSTKFYLHTIGLPRYLYQRYLEKERDVWSPQSPREFVIPSNDWNKLTPISVKEYSKKELLGLSSSSRKRRELHQKYEPGALSRGINDLDDDQFNWKMGLNR